MKNSGGKLDDDGLEIISIGKLYKGSIWDKKYWSSSRGKDRYPYPVGYHAVRTQNGTTYKMEISQGLKGPSFVITSTDGESCSGQTPDMVWDKFQKNTSPRLKLGHAKRFSCKIDGVEIFGFRNALVQRLLWDLVSNVNGTAEKNLSSTSLCNEACIIEPDEQFPESCTRPDLLPFLIKPQSTRKRSRKHNTATTHTASGPERKKHQAHNVSDNAEFSITRKENQKNHTGEDCQVDIKANSLSLAVKLNGAVEVVNNSFSVKDDLDLESLRFANSLKEDVALSQERKLVGSEDHRCTSPVTGLSKEEEHIDTLLAADTLGSNSSEADKDETGKTNSREFKSVKTLDLYVPDSLDILQDNVSDSALKHKKVSPCQIKNEQDAPGLVFSEDMVRSLPLENEVDTYSPNGNSERSNDDSAEQDFANSMMTLLLPQALPLLKKTSGRKRKKVRTSESSFSNGDVRLNLATTKSSEESHGMHTYNKLSSGEPKTGTCAEGSLKDREGQPRCLSTAPCFESENLENIKSVVPDSLEDTSYQTPSGSDYNLKKDAILRSNFHLSCMAANKIHLKEKSENVTVNCYENSLCNEISSRVDNHLSNDHTILPAPPKDFPSSDPAFVRQTDNLPIQVENAPNCAIPNLRLADDLPCSGSAYGAKVVSFTADTEHFEKLLPPTKSTENMKKGRSNNELIQYHRRNHSTGKKLQNSSRDVKDVNPTISGNSVYTSEKEVDVIKTSDSRMDKISTSMEMLDLRPTSKFRGPLSESIICRSTKDGCVPEAEISLTTEVDQVCASVDSSTRKISLRDESKLDEPYQVLSTEMCSPRSNGMISQVQAVDDHAAEDKEIKDVDDDQADANIDSSDSSLLFQERERSFFSNDNVHGPDKNAVDLGFHPQLMSVTSSHQDSVNLLSHIELNQKHLLPNQHTSPKTEFNRTSENFVELVGCYVQPAPILSVVLSTQGDDIHISVLCGILADRVRTIFIYKVPLRDPRKGYPVFLGYTSIMLRSSKYTFCGEIAFGKFPLQFTPDGQCLVSSNSIKAPYCRDRSIHCSCSLCTTVCFDENAIQIIHVKLGYVSLVAKMKTDDSVLSILVCEPSHLVALEKNGRLQVWAMNSTWSDRAEEFILPTVDHMSPCIMEIKRIPNYPSLIIGHNGFGDFGLWDISKRIIVSRFSAPHNCVYQFVPVGLFSWKRGPSASLYIEEKIKGIMAATEQCFSGVCENLDILSFNGEDIAVWLLISAACDSEDQYDHQENSLVMSADGSALDGSWRLAFLVDNMVVSGSALDPRASFADAFEGCGFIGTHDGLIYNWELSTGLKLADLHHFKSGHVSCMSVDSKSGVLTVAGDENQLLLYAKLRP
ncbi:hypothetical protein IFM89_004628 [Coptis chinensis]|uniref:FYR C-terminal domain-containing protein n=1 Tax=Coptis chinensis TaxID=261450 RepID=A0A835H3K8_9MAGN|nr:hypothetical protein IFM89_004628 [Coptis chinensis]